MNAMRMSRRECHSRISVSHISPYQGSFPLSISTWHTFYHRLVRILKYQQIHIAWCIKRTLGLMERPNDGMNERNDVMHARWPITFSTQLLQLAIPRTCLIFHTFFFFFSCFCMLFFAFFFLFPQMTHGMIIYIKAIGIFHIISSNIEISLYMA